MAEAENSKKREKMRSDVAEKLKKVDRMRPDWCIYRVPRRLRQLNPEAYTPNLISIGPLHRSEKEDPGIGDMEQHKWRYTYYLLRRVGGGHQNNTTDNALESCMNAIWDAEMEIRDRYAATIEPDSEELAKMLLLDSCFILELFFRYSQKEVSEKVQNDPLFQSGWMLLALKRDLALLENQIPFFLLKRLFYMVVEHDASLRADYLPRLAFNFFFGLSGQQLLPLPLMEAESGTGIHECKHLLDLLLKCYLPWPPRPSSASVSNKPLGVTIPSVKSLLQAGARIKNDQTTNNLFNIHFTKGVLQLPTLHIHEWTESLFRNLIAFEHCCPRNGAQYIVSYVVLMDRLIHNKEDVELLETEKIITVELGGSEDVINFFRDICKQVVVNDFYFQDQCEKMQEHYRSKLYKNLRSLKQDYLKDFWTFLSVIAAVLLLVCTIIQTVNSFK